MDCKKNFEIKFSSKNKYNRKVKFFKIRGQFFKILKSFKDFVIKLSGAILNLSRASFEVRAPIDSNNKTIEGKFLR